MSRLQKKKTESQKSKQKQKQKERQDRQVAEANTTGTPLKAVKSPQNLKKKKSVPSEPGIVEKSMDFLREVKGELKKVTWPPKNQTIASTVVVIIMVMIIASFLGIVDVGLKGVIRMVLK
jgi:preprotein translocase subunit SecE